MDEVNTILQYKGKIARGGKEVRTLAEELRKNRSIEETSKLAHTLFAHEEVVVQMVAVFIFGILASQREDALAFLNELVAEELEKWDTTNKKVLFTYGLASKFLS
jgi:hypothetical protein